MKKTIIIIFILNYLGVSYGISSINFLNDTIQLKETQIELLLNKANEIYTSDITKAIDLSGKALNLADSLGSKKLIADCNFQIGSLYLYAGIFDDAMDYTERALSIYKSLKQDDKSYEAIFLIGRIYLLNAEFKMAQKYFSDFYEHAINKKDTNLMVKALNSKGVIYGNTGKMDSAMNLFQQIYKMSKSSGNLYFEVRSLFNMGDVFLYSEKPKEAIKIYSTIAQNYKAEQIEFKQHLYLYNSTTFAYIKLGMIDSAKYYSAKTWNKLKENILYDELMSYYELKFKIDTLEKNYRSALKCYMNFTNLRDSLKQSDFDKQLANFESLYNLEKKEKHIQSLKFDNEIKDAGIKRRNIVIYGSLFLIVLLILLILQVYRSIKRTKKTNLVLQKQKEELSTANEEILAQTDDLNEKNLKLEKLINELRQTQEQLIESEKMASIGTLTAGIAHEINNPLNYISGGLLIINRIKNNLESVSKKEQSDLLKKASEVIDVGLERTIKITRALMTFSYTGKPILVKTDINKLIEDTLIVLNSKIDESVSIIKEFGLKAEVPVYADKINQVILNIIDNAIYAVTHKDNSEKIIKIKTEEYNNFVKIKVFNTGSKLSQKELKQIFDPFFTTKDPGVGTGLGLSICYNLVSEHKGRITVENYKNGILFTIKLPRNNKG